MIWRLALPGPRVFEVGGGGGPKADEAVAPCKNTRGPRPLAPPAVAAVCREARRAAMFGGGRWRSVRPQQQPQPQPQQQQQQEQEQQLQQQQRGPCDPGLDRGWEREWERARGPRWTWFDAETDVLFVRGWCYSLRSGPAEQHQHQPAAAAARPGPHAHAYAHALSPGHSRFFDLRDFCRDVRAVCLDARALVWQPLPAPRVFAVNMMDRRLWPRLETYLYCGDVVYLHLPPGVIRTLAAFADGRQTALVDVADAAELARLARLHDAYCRPWSARHRRGHRGHGAAAAAQDRGGGGGGGPPSLMDELVDRDLNRRYAERQLDRLRNVWLHAHYSDLPDDAPELRDPAVFTELALPDPRHPRFNHHHPWAQDALSKMPEYRLVVVFQLCMARHLESKV